MQFLQSRLARRRWPVVVRLAALLLLALGARLALLQDHRDPMAGVQLFAGLQGLGTRFLLLLGELICII